MLVNLTSKILNVKSRAAVLDGDPFEVFPMISMVEGSLNYLLYPNEEMEKSTITWNVCPATNGHPKIDNMDVSANTPETIEEFNFGRILNSQYRTKPDGRGCLYHEAWIDLNKCNGRDDLTETLERMRDPNENVEVSTGLYIDIEATEGEFEMPNGERRYYAGIARNFVPDHIAILGKGVIGASSYADGAGIRANQSPTVNNKMNELLKRLKTFATEILNMSDVDVREQLRELIDAKLPNEDWHYVESFDMDNGTFLVETDSNTYQGTWERDSNDIVTIGDELIEGDIERKFKPKTDNADESVNNSHKENEPMSDVTITNDEMEEFKALKAEKAASIENKRKTVAGFNSAFTVDVVNSMDEAQLDAVIAMNADVAPTEAPADNGKGSEDDDKEEMEKDKMDNQIVETNAVDTAVNSDFSGLGSGIVEAMNSGKIKSVPFGNANKSKKEDE